MSICDSISGDGRGGVAHRLTHQPTKNKAMLPSLSTHPLAPGVQKKSLPGAGGAFLTRVKWEVEALTRGEAMAR
jgi:hypothetical protein